MGDLYYDRGDYDSAIAEYQKGLRADPANTNLQSKIQNAKKAKAAEERLLH
jgi:tetratricopeptide (TPR) repeat protein